ncbi:hypothetical protein FRC10_002375 [Ceratobasidium sp. 414]|nr:hypothetical protein FRC10_002375 [Ceratobasidium sp. 414]
MWMHIDDYPEYNEAKVGVATSSSVCGDYTYQDDFRPGGLDSRDFTVFQDTDGKAYLVTEQRADGTAIYQLSDDYMSIGPRVFKWDEKHESPAMIKTSSGVYFLFVSGLTYSRMSYLQKFAPDGSNTFDSQTSFVLPLGNDKFMYMGGMSNFTPHSVSEPDNSVSDRWDGPDRWWMSDHLFRSTYVWLPLEISGITASMQNNYASWTLDVGSGSMALVSTKGYEAENALMSGSAKRVDCEGCSGKGAVGYIGGSGNGTLTFNITSDTDVRTTLRIEAPNGDRRVRNTTVTTNGAVQVIPVLPSNNGNVPGPVALHVDLKRGGNTIMISGFGSENAVDIDVIVVST